MVKAVEINCTCSHCESCFHELCSKQTVEIRLENESPEESEKFKRISQILRTKRRTILADKNSNEVESDFIDWKSF